jgi:hypothetical protein
MTSEKYIDYPVVKVFEEEAKSIIETREPRGRFWLTEATDEGIFITAIDNTTGDAFTEAFDTLDDAVTWLFDKSIESPPL